MPRYGVSDNTSGASAILVASDAGLAWPRSGPNIFRCDGTGDEATLTDAISSLPDMDSDSIREGKIALSEGTFSWDNPITNGHRFWLDGAGPHATRIIPSTSWAGGTHVLRLQNDVRGRGVTNLCVLDSNNVLTASTDIIDIDSESRFTKLEWLYLRGGSTPARSGIRHKGQSIYPKHIEGINLNRLIWNEYRLNGGEDLWAGTCEYAVYVSQSTEMWSTSLLTSNMTAGDTTIQVVSTTGLANNSRIRIYDDSNSEYNWVVSVDSPTQITVRYPARYTYTTAANAAIHINDGAGYSWYRNVHMADVGGAGTAGVYIDGYHVKVYDYWNESCPLAAEFADGSAYNEVYVSNILAVSAGNRYIAQRGTQNRYWDKQRRTLGDESFEGLSSFPAPWQVATANGGSVSSLTTSGLGLVTGGGGTGSVTLNMANAFVHTPYDAPLLEFGLTPDLGVTQVTIRIGLYVDGSNYAYFELDSGATAANWFAKTAQTGQALQSTDSSIAAFVSSGSPAATRSQNFLISCEGVQGRTIRYSLNGVQIAAHTVVTDGIGDAVPYVYIIEKTANSRRLVFSKFFADANRGGMFAGEPYS